MAIEDTFIPVHYHVTIDLAGLGGAAPADGFIDNLSPSEYSGFPTTTALSEAKERANIRWEEIIRQTSRDISPIRVLDTIATGADQDTEASEMSFTLVYDRPEYVRTEDELNPGTYLTGIDAVKRWVARALIVDISGNRDFYSPEVVDGIVQGPMILNIPAGAIAPDLATAEANITVILSDLTT